MAFSPRGLIFPEGYLSESLPRGNGAVPIAPRGNGAVAIAQGRDCRGARGVSRSELNRQRRKYEQ